MPRASSRSLLDACRFVVEAVRAVKAAEPKGAGHCTIEFNAARAALDKLQTSLAESAGYAMAAEDDALAQNVGA